MKKNKLFSIVLVLCLSIACTEFTYAQTFAYKSHKNTSIASYTMPYRLFVPEGYDSTKIYPLVLFLHGAGERGTDNESHIAYIRGAKLWAEKANQTAHPCFVLAPQCPADKQWVNTNWSNGSYSIDNVPVSKELLMVKDIIESLQLKYGIDSTQMFVTGLSMGGYGTWDFILRYPDMFKAAIPICGAGDPSKAERIRKTPLRVFHSSDDPTVPVAGSRDMVNAINQFGPNNRGNFYTEYTDQGHFAWVKGYDTADLPGWFFTTPPINLSCNDTLVPNVSINPFSVNTPVNSLIQLTASVTPDENLCNNSVLWASANPEIVTIDQTGNILCKKGGKTTITAISYQGNTVASCEVTVTGNNKKYEAENGTLNGIIVYNNHGGFSGTGFVAPFWVVGDYVEYNIQKAEAGEQNIILRYSNGYPDDRTISLYVNGEKIRQVNLPNTFDWENWGDRVDKVTLKEGDNTIRYQVDNGDNGMFNIDYLLVTTTEISGTNQLSDDSKISLYPNPNNSIITLANVQTNSKIKVISTSGKVISEVISDAEKMTFDVSNWTKGVYIFYIETKNSVVTRKAIIQ
jgi:poly(3-hydroxybutyrate) depolymerase